MIVYDAVYQKEQTICNILCLVTQDFGDILKFIYEQKDNLSISYRGSNGRYLLSVWRIDNNGRFLSTEELAKSLNIVIYPVVYSGASDIAD